MKRFNKLRPAAAAFLMMMAVSTTSTGFSFMNQPIAEALGIGMGKVTFYYSLMVATGALTAPIVGQFINKIGVPKFLLAAAAWGTTCLFLFSVANSLWAFYAVAVMLGVLGGAAINMVATVALQTFYTTAEAASLIGIVMAGSGVGAMMYSALIPGVLESMGIGTTYRVIGIIWLVILLAAFLILGNPKPAVSEKSGSAGGDGMTRAEALKSPMLYMLVVSVVLLTCGSGLIQHFPSILAEQGHSSASSGAVISFYSAVVTVGKIVQGMLYGKAGIKKGAIVVYGLFIAGFVFLLIPGMSYPAFFCVGIGVGIMTTLLPVLAKMLFGQKEYASIYGIVAMVMSMGSFVATPVWGIVYDSFGSYRPGFIFMPALLILAFVLQMMALRVRRKIAE